MSDAMNGSALRVKALLHSDAAQRPSNGSQTDLDGSEAGSFS
ncbi:MAG TPA: hypothetical protein VGN98_02320 [Tianweitania sediminis]|jgi:hypothetical protein|nr:hypothetical protein [Tianweitania sediminis]